MQTPGCPLSPVARMVSNETMEGNPITVFLADDSVIIREGVRATQQEQP
jgi:hypothetical protein